MEIQETALPGELGGSLNLSNILSRSRTEHRQNETITHKRDPGRRGRVGPPGARPPTYLQGGVGGAQGSSQVTVKRNNGTEATYPTRYELRVVSFDVVDENDDGINEPGEYLLVQNIRVQNTGKLSIQWLPI